MKKATLLIFALTFLNYTAPAQQRIVLLEQFTNSGCSTCATHSPTTYSYVDNNSAQVVAISYHTAFPYFDSMYLENTVESNARTSFYNVVSVPYSIIDGNYYRNSTAVFNTVLSSTVAARAAIAPKYSITPIQNDFNGNMLTTKFEFQSVNSMNVMDSLRAIIVVIEKEVLKSSYLASPGNNSLTSYKYVMRKMLPNSSGSFLINRALNGMDTISYTWNMQHIKNKGELRVVAFVQNSTTKEIYNSILVDPNDVTSVKQLASNEATAILFPNPASHMTTITFPSLINKLTLQLIDSRGRILIQSNYQNTAKVELNLNEIQKGFYFLSMEVDGVKQFKKLVVE